MTGAAASHPVDLQPPVLDRWKVTGASAPFVVELRGMAQGPEVLLCALVHGNEFAGAIALHELLQSGLRPRRGRITVAFCNVEAFGRFDPAQPDASRFVDEDLNRVWLPERLDGNGQSVELARARELRPLVERADFLLDLHSMHEPCAPLLVTGLLPRNVAFAQSLRTAAQVVADEGHADGVRMRDFGGFGDPQGDRIALLLEAGQHWETRSLETSRDMVMRFLVAAGCIQREDVLSGWLLPDARSPAPLLVTHRVVARTRDFAFTRDFHGSEVIERAGTPIAHDGGRPVLTPYDDCVLVMPSVRQLRPGVTTVRLGRYIGLAAGGIPEKPATTAASP